MQCDQVRAEHQKRKGESKDSYSELRDSRLKQRRIEGQQIASGYVKVVPHDSAQSTTTSEPNDTTSMSETEASDHSEPNQASITMYDMWRMAEVRVSMTNGCGPTTEEE